MPKIGRPKKKQNLKTFRKIHRRKTMHLSARKIYPYIQWCDTALLTAKGITSSALVDSTVALQFQLDMLPQYATFTALYDQYRIVKVEIHLNPRVQVFNGMTVGQGTVAQNYTKKIIWTIDNDDAVAPTNYNTVREYGNSHEFNLINGNSKVITFKPAVSAYVYNGVSPAYGERFSPWIDVAYPSVPHYGIKMALPVSTTVNDCTVDFSARYYIEFRSVR